ncbi:MAG: glycogen debranching protein [Trebonia sp.]
MTAGTDVALRDQAAAVLRGNDAGGWTKASPLLYPHQWSWDSAFIAIGWAHLDVRRAMTELEQLFAAQWSTGMVPHIVCQAGHGARYFPGPEWWDCAAVTPAARGLPARTTGICQPPVHALAVRRIWQLTPPPLQPEIRARIEAFRPGPYTRLDTSELGDPAQRPTNWDYDRYLWLVELLREYRYDDEQIHRHYPFQIKDVFFSAVLVAANAALLDLAGVAGAGDGNRAEVAGWLDRGRAGLARQFDAGSGLCADYDVRAGEQIRLRTFAGFAPLFARTADAGQRAAQLRLLDSADFCGNPRLRWPLLPSTSPAEPAFEPHNYWRGPVWPVIDWLLWQSLTELGCADRAGRTAPRLARPGHRRRRVQRVLRPVHRRAARLAPAVLDSRRRAGLGGPAVLTQSSMRAPMMTVLSRGSWKYSAASAVSRAVATNRRLRQRLMPGVFPRRISMVDRK